MRRIVLITVALALSVVAARADTEVDRLRDAVRSMTGQLRTLEDQRAQAQAKLSQAEREKTLALKAAETLKGQLKDAQKQLQEAIEEFNKRLANRDETLEKWKAAYAQAADVAREKDTLRAKFEDEAGAFKARTKSCEAKNRQLLKVSGQILAAYRDLTPLDNALIREPLIGIAKVDHENQVQCFQDKVLDQDARLPAAAAPEKPAEPAKDHGAKTEGTKIATKKPEPKQKPAAASEPSDGNQAGAATQGSGQADTQQK